MKELSREVRTLLCGVRPVFDETARAALEHSLLPATDWNRLIELAKRHGLTALFHRRLNVLTSENLPAQVRSEFSSLARRQRTFALALTAELRDLLKLLERNDIPALPYKGPALAAQLYGDPTLRSPGDLDVLIRAADLPRAQDMLQAHGWRKDTVSHGAQDRLLERYYNAYDYHRSLVLLELHWSVVERHHVFPLAVDDLLERSAPLTLLNGEIRVPSPEDTLLLICFHGAKHLWERIGLVCDVAQLLVTQRSLDWDVTLQRAARLGCERVLWMSLGLARDFLGAPLPPEVARKVESDATARALAAQAASSWFSPGIPATDNLARVRFQLQMRERWGDRARYRLRLYFRTTPADWALLPFALPNPLSYLYLPLRFGRLLRKYVLPG